MKKTTDNQKRNVFTKFASYFRKSMEVYGQVEARAIEARAGVRR